MPVDVGRALAFLGQAQEDSLPSISSLHVRFDAAYNAAHDAGEAMLAAYGYRTGSGQGAHVAVGEFRRAVFDGSSAQEAAAT